MLLNLFVIVMISNEEKERIRKLPPKLIREDPTILGVILGVLEEILLTKEDFQEFIKAKKKRFEARNKRFELMASKEDS